MANVVAFLKENAPNGPDLLTSQFAIHVVRHKVRPSLVLFKYDQLNSPMAHPIVQECRGLVLDEANDWSIVVFPYQKFFNMREMANAAVIDWSGPVRAYEKIDGSLLTMYHSAGEWHVATSGVPDASGGLHSEYKRTEDNAEDGVEPDENNAESSTSQPEEARSLVPDPVTGLTPVGRGPNRKTNAELFWEVFKLLNYRLPEGPVDERKCYMFELATPQNRVLIPHTKAQLYLHGVRNLETLAEELPDPFCERYSYQLAPMKLITKGKAQFEQEILTSVNSLDGMKTEGYVICDAYFNRFKLKCQSYVNMALLPSRLDSSADANAWKRLIAIAQVNEGSEFLAYFPQYADLYASILNRYLLLIDTLNKTAKLLENLDNKALASTVKLLPEWMPPAIFSQRRTKEDFKTYYSAPTRLMQLTTLLDPSKPIPTLPNLEELAAAIKS